MSEIKLEPITQEPKTELEKQRFEEAQRKCKVVKRVIVNISIELNSLRCLPVVSLEVPRILREYADIESSLNGGRDKVETYTDKFGNKLTSIVALDFGSEIPYSERDSCGWD